MAVRSQPDLCQRNASHLGEGELGEGELGDGQRAPSPAAKAQQEAPEAMQEAAREGSRQKRRETEKNGEKRRDKGQDTLQGLQNHPRGRTPGRRWREGSWHRRAPPGPGALATLPSIPADTSGFPATTCRPAWNLLSVQEQPLVKRRGGGGGAEGKEKEGKKKKFPLSLGLSVPD